MILQIERREIGELGQGFGALAERRDHFLKPRIVAGNRKPALLDKRADLARELSQRALLHVMEIQPEQFFGIEKPGRLAALLEAEELDQLAFGKNLLISVRPSKARKIVEKRLRKISAVAIFTHRS